MQVLGTSLSFCLLCPHHEIGRAYSVAHYRLSVSLSQFCYTWIVIALEASMFIQLWINFPQVSRTKICQTSSCFTLLGSWSRSLVQNVENHCRRSNWRYCSPKYNSYTNSCRVMKLSMWVHLGKTVGLLSKLGHCGLYLDFWPPLRKKFLRSSSFIPFEGGSSNSFYSRVIVCNKIFVTTSMWKCLFLIRNV